jgi:hypothetical protein
MPPLPVISGVVRCALNWENGAGQHAVNVIHVTPTGGTALDAFNLLDANVTVDMWSYVTDDFYVTHVQCTPLDGTSATEDFPTGSPGKWRGSATSDFIPASCSLVKLQTGLRGREHRGRVYLPFLAELQQTAGTLAAGGMSGWQDAWDTFVSDLSGALVVASYKLASSDSVTSVVCENKAATQRRRQARVRAS